MSDIPLPPPLPSPLQKSRCTYGVVGAMEGVGGAMETLGFSATGFATATSLTDDAFDRKKTGFGFLSSRSWLQLALTMFPLASWSTVEVG